MSHLLEIILALFTDSVDLSVAHFSLDTPIVDSNSYIGVNLWLKVDLEGSRTLAPDASTDVYQVQLFLSTDKTLDASDKEVCVILGTFLFHINFSLLRCLW